MIKVDCPTAWRMNATQVNEISDVDTHLIRIAKALARDEASPDAFYFYVGEAVNYRNANRRDNSDRELERVTLEAEKTNE